MSMGFSIFALGLIALSLGAIIGFGLIGYKGNNKKAFSFLSYFPFELNEGHDLWSRLSSYSVFLLAGALALASTGMLWNENFRPFLSVAIFMAIFGILKAVALIFVFRVPAYHFKFHCVVSVAYFSLVALTSCFAGIFFLNMSKVFESGAIAMMVIEFVCAFLLACIAINPKLSKWTELESVGNEDGSVEIRRPRPFVLALSEWCAIFVDLLATLTFVVGILLITLN